MRDRMLRLTALASVTAGFLFLNYYASRLRPQFGRSQIVSVTALGDCQGEYGWPFVFYSSKPVLRPTLDLSFDNDCEGEFFPLSLALDFFLFMLSASGFILCAGHGFQDSTRRVDSGGAG